MTVKYKTKKSLACPKCGHALSPEAAGGGKETRCPDCGAALSVFVFPAFLRPAARGRQPAPLMTGEEAACYHHADRQATAVCECCGRFLCELCRIEIAGQILCSACLQAGNRKGRMRDLARRCVLHDEIALSLAVLPLLAWPFTIATAPAAVIWAIRHWNSPSGIIPRTKVRFVIAILLGSIQITAWIAFLATIVFFAEG